MEFRELSETGLPIERDEMLAVFDPFVTMYAEESSAAWREEVGGRRKKIARKYLKRLLLGWREGAKRDESFVKDEYSEVWESTAYQYYSLKSSPPRSSPWEWNGKRMLASTFGGTRVRQLMLVRFIEQLKPRSVLEVGCGNGINLLLLASRFPDIEFTGLELTTEGNRVAREFQDQEQLPDWMQEFAPLPLQDIRAFKRINFIQGSATEIPYPDDSFDLVITVLSLEQMERVRHQALAEIARVSARNTLMIEPFKDVNRWGWSWANVVRRNYFRGSIEGLREFGLEPVLATRDFPQEEFLKVCAVLSEKRPVS